MKRCPNGTRKDKNGNCVPKVTGINSFNVCDEDREWYMGKCYKKCKPIQHRNPETRRCRRTCTPDEVRNPNTKRCVKIPKKQLKRTIKRPTSTSSYPVNRPIQEILVPKRDEKYERILERFIRKIKKNITDQPNIQGSVRKHSKLNIQSLKSMCGDIGICLSLNNNYDRIMDMFDNFNDFKYLINSPREIASGANGSVHLLKYTKIVGSVSFNSYTTLKIPRNATSDNLAYEYLVGKLGVNPLCRYFPVFVQTYNLYFIERNTRLRFINPVTRLLPITREQFINGIDTLDPLGDPTDLLIICTQLASQVCLTGQFYNNFMTFMSYGTHQTNKNYSDFPFILFQVYYTLYYLKTIFTHYDLHYENVGLVSLPDGFHVEYEYNVFYNGKPVVIRFKSKYIVKLIDYGRCFFQSIEDPLITSRKLIEDFNKTNICVNKFGSLINNLNSSVKNESADLRFLRFVNVFPNTSPMFTNYPILQNTISNLLYETIYSTTENLDNLGDGVIRNVTDAHNYFTSYIINNTENVNGLNHDAYLNSNSLGTLRINHLVRPMEFIPSVRMKRRGDRSRFEMPEIVNVSL
jgi:hypothetical protein